MLESFLEEYIQDLYKKQNEGGKLEQKYLYTPRQYFEILKPVVELVREKKDDSLEELRKQLYKNAHIEENIRNFIYNKRLAPGMVLSYGTMNYKETIVVGNRKEALIDGKEKKAPMTEKTIFDLASVSKLFLSLSFLKLAQLGMVDLNDPIIKYVPNFTHLKDVTIFDLLSFHTPLKTSARITEAMSQKEVEDIVFSMYKDEDFVYGTRPYTDMGSIVLRYVIENITGMKLYDFINQNILKNTDMKETYVKVPSSKIERLASTNLEYKLMKSGKVQINDKKEGLVNDPKALALGQKEGILAGHAGLFSTANDMTKLSKAIINEEIINREYLNLLSKNRTGEVYYKNGEKKHIQYLGLLCYVKHPNLMESEVFHALSGRAFASAGYTGMQLTIDPLNEVFLFLGSNRTHNRITYVDSSQSEKIKLQENGTQTVTLSNIGEKIVSSRFAWDRDEEVIHPALKLTLQYKMLEDIYRLQNETIKKEVKVKTIRK